MPVIDTVDNAERAQEYIANSSGKSFVLYFADVGAITVVSQTKPGLV